MIDIVCPSGLSGSIKGLSVGQAQILSNRKFARDGVIATEILKVGWQQTIDPGPYKFDNNPHWDDVLIGDILYAVMMTRVATYGSHYDFDVGCRNCEETIKWRIDLNDIEVKKYPKESLDTFILNNEFETKTSDGSKIIFKLLDGKSERMLQSKLKKAPNKLAAVLAHRIALINGVKNKMKWINDLPLGTAHELIELFDEYDGGIDTNISVICDNCGVETEVLLPFDRPAFWMPQKKAKS